MKGSLNILESLACVPQSLKLYNLQFKYSLVLWWDFVYLFVFSLHNMKDWEHTKAKKKSEEETIFSHSRIIL